MFFLNRDAEELENIKKQVPTLFQDQLYLCMSRKAHSIS
jgi:hypothetical protein